MTDLNLPNLFLEYKPEIEKYVKEFKAFSSDPVIEDLERLIAYLDKYFDNEIEREDDIDRNHVIYNFLVKLYSESSVSEKKLRAVGDWLAARAKSGWGLSAFITTHILSIVDYNLYKKLHDLEMKGLDILTMDNLEPFERVPNNFLTQSGGKEKLLENLIKLYLGPYFKGEEIEGVKLSPQTSEIAKKDIRNALETSFTSTFTDFLANFKMPITAKTKGGYRRGPSGTIDHDIGILDLQEYSRIQLSERKLRKIIRESIYKNTKKVIINLKRD